MKTLLTIVTFIVVSLYLTSCTSTSGTLPPLSQVNTVAKEGTLTNHVLAQDASLAIRKIMGGKNKRVTKFVLQQPVGNPGSKAWREMWVYDPEGVKKMFIMTFKENGQGSADFEIKPM